jgi:hypothetical protein
MTSVTLVHPEETFTIPFQAITKCNLFQNNLTLADTPYSVQSSITLSIFQEFVSALEGNSIKITDTNLIGLQQLCEEFGFDELLSQLSPFFQPSDDSLGRQLRSPLTQMRSALLSESFLFVTKGTVIESDISEAIALFPSIREQPSVDGCARKFFVKHSGIESADIRSLQLLLSGEAISIGRSQGLLNNLLGNVNLEQMFLSCSRSNIQKNLSDLGMKNRIDFESADISVLSIEALDSLLLSESISVVSEDSLFRHILKLGSDYRDLL